MNTVHPTFTKFMFIFSAELYMHTVIFSLIDLKIKAASYSTVQKYRMCCYKNSNFTYLQDY